MRLTLSRRIVSYFIDAIPILLVVVLMHTWFVGGIIESQIDNYQEIEETYYTNYDQYQEDISDLITQFDEGLITEQMYEDQRIALYDDFFAENEEGFNAVSTKFLLDVMYFTLTYIALYFTYMLILKGNSFGRHFMGGELSGNVKWYTIFMREVMWKHFFWLMFVILGSFISTLIYIPSMVMALLAISGISFDIALIGFSQKKKTLRDTLTNTDVTYKGVNYPF